LQNGIKDWWLTRISPLIDDHGKVYKLIGSALKITDLKKVEGDLTNKNIELARLNEELEQFTYANQELNQFAYTASHQLQEPIRTISNYLNVIKEDYASLLDRNVLGYFNTIEDATKRMAELINSLLDYSRLGRNKKLVHVDCNQLIDKVISDLNYVISSSDANIVVSDMPVLSLYEIEVHQLFQNLIKNSIKFQKKGARPEIQIVSEKLDRKWQFSVTDNGIGIDPRHFERIFQIFQRLHTNEEEYEGKGIGLAYCKKIVQMHLGEIWVNSNPGKGSTFYFTIPVL
jgi:light-regulated signal transduction histidine kinase (bacteriophytochrome)